jgi:integrase
VSEPRKNPKTGKWDFVADLPSTDGRRRQAFRRGFATKKAAVAAQRLLLAQAEQGLAIDASSVTVGRYLTETWLPSLDGRNLRATTLDSYRRAVTKHLVPELGAVKLQRLDSAMIERLSGSLAQRGLSAKTRRNVHGVLSKALADALRWKLVNRNAASGVELPRAARPTPRVWDAGQMARFLARVDDERLAPLWRFYFVTGARRGEALGLRWSDVDLASGLVTITNQRTIAGGKIVEGPPKTTSGARTIALDADTIARLRRWSVDQRAEYLALGIRPTHGYVFTSIEGRPLSPKHVTVRFGDYCDELGLSRIGVHGLRHSAATWLISQGWNPKVVAHRFGHASSAITIALYSHVLPAHDRAAADALAAAIGADSVIIP